MPASPTSIRITPTAAAALGSTPADRAARVRQILAQVAEHGLPADWVPPEGRTAQVSLRPDPEVLAAVRLVLNSHPARPSVADVVEVAIRSDSVRRQR